MADGGRCLGLTAILALALLPIDVTALVNQFGAPTLVYNCAKMPSICTNVHARNPLLYIGTSSSNVAVNRNLGKLDPGQTPGGLTHLNLQFDTDNVNKNIRRGQSCPDAWSKTHACPETNQPRVIPQGSSWGHGGYDAVAYNRAQNIANGKKPGDAGFNQIADLSGNNPSGMIWSCDEWPPATFTNGGAGANTYCAPWAQKCVSTATGGTTPAVQTEQDFQGLSHGALRRHVSDASFNPTGVWDFKFETMWHDEADAVAASVSYNFDVNAESSETIAKRWFGRRRRSWGPTHRGTEMFFSNGTRAHIFRALTEDEHNENVRTGVSGTYPEHSPAKQLFGSLNVAPPLPIVDITRNFIRESAKLPVIPYVERVLRTLSTPLKVPGGLLLARSKRSSNYVSTFDTSIFSPFDKRAGAGGCSASNPCPDGSCCNKKGLCGYGQENCGAGNCASNCNATALCGKDSAGGSVKCPLNVCCSYYGYCGTDSDYCTSPNPDAPCQKGFGSCSTVSAPSCGGSSSSGRSIAYYQVANVRERQCNRITPAQINTAGLTHLNLAFASIDPSSFQVVPGDAADVAIYSNFTALKSSTLQTWIAIGGWDFSDPGPTRTTWSDMASSSANRAAFISSLKSFMAKYGFQGVDLDWEYPGAPDRAGKPGDTQNLVRLVKEMRASFGSSYGISATLPSSYWYMRWFDPIAMQPYVDFFGVMTYDLHGPWDKNVRAIGPTVLGQTNVAEIFNWTLPLWYDGVDPAKLNMGLAYYGRGYTLADPNCNTPGCKWSGPSRPAPCTNFPGVMSLQEIQNLLPQVGVSPTLDSTAMMKYLTYSDQWIGYDDLQTIGRKKAWANSHCWGGTMIWSIDLFSGAGSGNTPDGGGSSNPSDPGSGDGQGGSTGGNSSGIVYIDPSIWSDPHPTIQCQPPCTFILPPYTLGKPTTISIPPLTTSLDVAWSESTGWTSITQTTVISVPPVTTTAIEVWQYTVKDTNSASGVSSTFYPTISVRPPPFTITDNPNPLSKSGVSHSKVTRTITPPPWPYSFVSPSKVLTTSATSTTTAIAAIFPIVTYKPGKPGPICRIGCGKPCVFFCSHPCLLDCSDGGNDFPDPANPKPPKKPTGKTPDDPDPTGTPVPPEGDPKGDEPEDPEEEDEDRACALEFGLPHPVYTGTIGHADQVLSTTKDGGVTITSTKKTISSVVTTKTTGGGGSTGPSGVPSTGSKVLYVTYCSSGSSFDSCNKYFSLFKDTTDFCSQTSPYYAEQAPPNSKGFATSMGPFDVNGHTNCKYYGDGGAGAGYFKCGDGKTSICKDISTNSSLNEKCSSSGFNYKGYAECHYD